MARHKFFADVTQRQTSGEKLTMSVALVMLVLVCIGGWSFIRWAQARLGDFFAVEAPLQDAPLPANPPVPRPLPQEQARPASLPSTQDRRVPKDPRPEVTISGAYATVTLNPRADGFSPIDFKVASTHRPFQTQLQQERFAGIRKEPAYAGHAQWYGRMLLGNLPDNVFHFVLDLQDNDRFLLYFDTNNNKDLADDGKPRSNSGSGNGGPGGYATALAIPWQHLIQSAPYDADFIIWLFSNEAGWNRGHYISHYSITQLYGWLTVGGTRYQAVLVDQDYNDADLSNDGIILDLNRNGRFDGNERAAPVHDIDRRQYKVDVRW